MELVMCWQMPGSTFFSSEKNNEIVDHLLDELTIEETAEEEGGGRRIRRHFLCHHRFGGTL